MPKRKSKKAKKRNDEIKLICSLLAITAVVAAACVIVDKKAENKPDGSSASDTAASAEMQNSSDQSTSSAAIFPAQEVTASVTIQSGASSKQSSSIQNPGTGSSDLPAVFDDGSYTGNTKESWNLILVNTRNTLNSSYVPDLYKEKQISGVYNGMYVSRQVYPAYAAMYNAAKADGITLSACSAYRPYSSQERNFNNRVEKYISQGKSRDEAESITAAVIARPGTSEHQTGLAIDFNPCTDDFEKSREYKWLKKHAGEYGFVQRYEKSKSSVTGIINESWHYRYVGVYNAKKMNDLGMCLEEYIDYLSKN